MSAGRSALRRDDAGTLVAPPSWLRSCCLPPRSAIRAALVVQSPRIVPSQRRAVTSSIFEMILATRVSVVA